METGELPPLGGFLAAFLALLTAALGAWVLHLRSRLVRAREREDELTHQLDGNDSSVRATNAEMAFVVEALGGFLADLTGTERKSVAQRGLSLNELLQQIAEQVRLARNAGSPEPAGPPTAPATTDVAPDDNLAFLAAARDDLAAVLAAEDGAERQLAAQLRLAEGVRVCEDLRAILSMRDWRADPALLREQLIRPELVAGVDIVLRADLLLATYAANDPVLARLAATLRFVAAILLRPYARADLRFSEHRLLSALPEETAGPVGFTIESDLLQLEPLAPRVRQMLSQAGTRMPGRVIRPVDVQTFGMIGPQGVLRRSTLVAMDAAGETSP